VFEAPAMHRIAASFTEFTLQNGTDLLLANHAISADQLKHDFRTLS